MVSLFSFCKKKSKKDWKRIDNEENWKTPDCMIYIIAWREKERAKPIKRLRGKDSHGILYIGCQTNSSRIKNFVNSAFNKKEQHSGGNRFKQFCFEKLTKKPNLYFAYKKITCKKARDLEKRWIRGYRRKYLDNPPLNSQE